MRHYPTVVVALLGLLLAVFIGVEAAGVSLLTDPSDTLAGAGPAAAALGVGLLVADVALPVPSSVVMSRTARCSAQSSGRCCPSWEAWERPSSGSRSAAGAGRCCSSWSPLRSAVAPTRC